MNTRQAKIGNAKEAMSVEGTQLKDLQDHRANKNIEVFSSKSGFTHHVEANIISSHRSDDALSLITHLIKEFLIK